MFQSICNTIFSSYHRKMMYLETSLRKSNVKKWLHMLPALNMREPLSLRSSAVFSVISLYSTTWYFPATLQTTPTASVGNAFSTTCNYDMVKISWTLLKKNTYFLVYYWYFKNMSHESKIQLSHYTGLLMKCSYEKQFSENLKSFLFQAQWHKQLLLLIIQCPLK